MTIIKGGGYEGILIVGVVTAVISFIIYIIQFVMSCKFINMNLYKVFIHENPNKYAEFFNAYKNLKLIGTIDKLTNDKNEHYKINGIDIDIMRKLGDYFTE